MSGPSERELAMVASRTALWLRVAVVASTGVFSVVADGRTTGMVLVVTGWCAFLLYRRTRRPPDGWLAVVDGLVVGAVGLSQLVLGPQPVSSWVYAVASITAVTSHYEWPRSPAAGWFVAGASVAGYAAGALFAAPGGEHWRWLPLAVQAGLTWTSFLFLRAGAVAADRIAERAAARRRAATVAAARRSAERAYLATLHDTASTTLLMVSSGEGDHSAWLPAQARRDLEALGAVPGSVAGEIDLAALLGPLGDFPGVRLELEIDGPLVLPVAPAFAIFLGAREAVNNVRQHAGGAAASLRAGSDETGAVQVTLVDRGPGFDPAEVSGHRRGIAESIIGRMRSAGGRAELGSRPGAGTTVRWRWPDG